jgi:indolepyruvate ferredoxin oxidoreductase beta subunit
MTAARAPTTMLIAALGGQGGGVLTQWIAQAARAEGLAVQTTSTPGVSQRTGATSYYVEIADAPGPVLALAPVPGRVDVLVCSELLEAARMIERGLCTPARTVVIASTHRVYTTREKMSGGDGRFDGDRIVAAIHALARRAVLLDMEALRRRHRAAISAALFGAIAGSGTVALSRPACEGAIRAAGVGVRASLAAFDEAFVRASSGAHGQGAAPPRAASLGDITTAGVAELTAFQDARYARQFIERVDRLSGAASSGAMDEALREGARSLALWMAYDDVIRVAAAKSKASRLARIRREVDAGADDIVRVRDFLKPGTAEVAAILPVRLGAWLERRSQGAHERNGRGMTIETSSVSGALAMRLLAGLRPLRRHSLRFAREQVAIDRWLVRLERELATGTARSALGIARLPRLRKGYGATHAAGAAAFDRAMDRDDVPARPYPVVWMERR